MVLQTVSILTNSFQTATIYTKYTEFFSLEKIFKLLLLHKNDMNLTAIRTRII